MIIFNRCFKPRVLFGVIVLSAVVVFTTLGLWQLDRAAFKSAVKAKYETRLNSDYQLLKLEKGASDIEYRKVILKGFFDNSRTFLADNIIFAGQAGYHVLTPFKLADSDYIILINRGWVSLGVSRQSLPEIRLPLVDGLVKGTVSYPITEGFRLGQVSLRDDWPQVIPYIDISALQAEFSNQLLPVVLWLSADESGHYKRQWDPSWADPNKSLAYAWQWFAFAFISVVLFVILNLRKIE